MMLWEMTFLSIPSLCLPPVPSPLGSDSLQGLLPNHLDRFFCGRFLFQTFSISPWGSLRGFCFFLFNTAFTYTSRKLSWGCSQPCPSWIFSPMSLGVPG